MIRKLQWQSIRLDGNFEYFIRQHRVILQLQFLSIEYDNVLNYLKLCEMLNVKCLISVAVLTIGGNSVDEDSR